MSIIYFSHGGGPLPILNDPSHAKMIEFMKNLPSKISRQMPLLCSVRIGKRMSLPFRAAVSQAFFTIITVSPKLHIRYNTLITEILRWQLKLQNC